MSGSTVDLFFGGVTPLAASIHQCRFDGTVFSQENAELNKKK